MASDANVAGYFNAELGVGQAGRGVLRVLQEAGVRCTTYTTDRTLSRLNHPFQGKTEANAPELNVVCVNADSVSRFAHTVGPRFFRGRYTVGVWYWELEQFPSQYWSGFNYVDEVWAGSSFTAAAIAEATTKPVEVFNPPLGDIPPLSLSRSELGLPEDRFIFLFCFDFFSSLERKNPLGLIEAYQQAFGHSTKDVCLVLKSINGHAMPGQLEKVREAAGGRPDILVVDGYLDVDVQGALMAQCDAYVSLHRSEGFGFTIAEAMNLGKPVIATGYSGNLDFMNDANSYLVDWAPGFVRDSGGPYPTGLGWAEPSISHAASLMADVVSNREAARTLGIRAAEDISDHLGLPARVKAVETLLGNIPGRRESADLVSTRIGRALTRDRVKGLAALVGRHSRWFPSLRRPGLRRFLSDRDTP